MIILCDIDGTIADCRHRLWLIDEVAYRTRVGPNIASLQFKPDWDTFFIACVNDAPIQPVIDIIKDLAGKVIFVTGRSDIVRRETKQWLWKHGLPCTDLYMRRQGDHRPDHVVKSELFDKILLDTHADLPDFLVFDDRDQSVQMWRKRGMRCFQVADGNF